MLGNRWTLAICATRGCVNIHAKQRLEIQGVDGNSNQEEAYDVSLSFSTAFSRAVSISHAYRNLASKCASRSQGYDSGISIGCATGFKRQG